MKTLKKEWGHALQLEDDLWRVRLRNPERSLIVNTYVYRGGDTLAVIDPGWAHTVDALQAALGDLELADSLAAVDRWLYTHAHIDHMGPAAMLERRSDAPHTAWSGLGPQLGVWHAFQDRVSDWRPWIDEAFIDPHRTRLLTNAASPEMVDRWGHAELSRAELVDFGDTIEVGELRLTLLDARGHDPHHGAWWEAERGWLFSGDVVLAAPTPICRSMDDNLADYKASLDRLEALDISLLLPGHGLHKRDRIDDAFDRARGFVREFARGTRRALRALGGPADLYSIALQMTPEGRPLKPASRWWVHLALVDSHLHAFVGAGEVEKLQGPRYVAS